MNWEYESGPDSDSDPEDDINHNKLVRKMKKAGWPGDGEGRDWDRVKFARLVSQGNNEGEYSVTCTNLDGLSTATRCQETKWVNVLIFTT